MLEGEVGSINLQKDLIQKDLLTITEQHDALKAAYHALSYESAHQHQTRIQSEDQQQQQQQQQSSPTLDLTATQAATIIELQRKFQESEENNRDLKNKLITIEKKMMELEKWPGVVNTIEERMNNLLNERSKLESIANHAKEEVIHYKKLTETLKDKMKKMSNNNTDTKQFLDSFEEGT